MFENAINWKKQGDIGMCYAMAYYSKLGWTISIPITDSQDYDIIVDNGINLLKVQIKTTTQVTKYGIPSVNLRTNGGNKSGTSTKNFDENTCDLVFVMTSNSEFYSIPRYEIEATTSINLGEKYLPYKVDLL